VLLDIDGLPLSQGNAYTVGLFDVGQVSVLKGPQALFFGKNNSAGVVSLRSNDPTDKPEFIARFGFEGEALAKQLDFIASGPVSQTLRLRLATRYETQKGFFHNNAVPNPVLGGLAPTTRRVSPNETWLVRGTALWEPTDRLTVNLKANYSDYHMDGSPPFEYVNCPDGTAGVAPANISFLAGMPCRASRTLGLTWMNPTAFDGIQRGGMPFQRTEQKFGILNVNYALADGLDLTSVTGLYQLDFFMQSIGAFASTATTNAAQTAFRERQFTQELRLGSDNPDSPLNFMIGAFYQRGSQFDGLRLMGNKSLNLPAVIQQVDNRVVIHSYSVFGQLRWNITPELELAPGVRWTRETRDHTQTNYNPTQGPLGPSALLDPHISSSKASPTVTLTYNPTDTFTAYAAYRTGVKSGSFNGVAFNSATQPSSFADESVKGGEIGVKSVMDDRRVNASLTGYYYKYSNLQVGANLVADLGNGNFASMQRTLNAAAATVKGIEFDLSYRPGFAEGLTLSTAGNYNRARYTSFPNAPCGNLRRSTARARDVQSAGKAG
jgi:outer membrane receptor protein involved in Fe transport